MTYLQTIANLREQGVLSALDQQLARSLCALVHETDPRVAFAIALLSRHVCAGHVCLPLGDLRSASSALGEEHAPLCPEWPDLPAWLDAVRASRLCGDASEPHSPLVLDASGRLYLRRHFDREQRLAQLLTTLAARELPADHTRVARRLAHYFGDAPNDLQRTAAELATRHALCVISGGPGTGKTSTVVKILAVSVEEALASGRSAPRIALTAPTGKAAVRLQSAVQGAKQNLSRDPRVLAAIPEVATTIHRALASRARRGRSEPGVGPEPLPLDLLLVDEASMVDLELMTSLLEALPPEARVILLGDRDQLASVEAGAVLGDICGVARDPVRAQHGLGRCIVQLTRSYRYDANSGIGELARAVQAGDAARALNVLEDPRFPEVQLCEATSLFDPHGEFTQRVVRGYRPYLQALDAQGPSHALNLFDSFRVLCAHRQGERGVLNCNRAIARMLYSADLVPASEGNFLGRPLMITENDYRTRLWNGDVGLVCADPEQGRTTCFLDTEGRLRRLGLGRLPPNESAFALSVHKSQGSEVDEVSLVLPRDPSRILSRELLYTGITRARRRVVIHGSRDILRAAIEQVVSRSTGLRELL
mgnify:CR=1 FL=1